MKTLRIMAALLAMALSSQIALSHCQVPCGIYDDAARLDRLREDATTIEKAVSQIEQLSGKADAQSANQLVRWITTKEQHASHIIEVVSEYFLTQKVKPVEKGTEGYDAYLAKLADHHRVMAAAMKAKQTCSTETVAALSASIERLALNYR